MNDFNIWLSQQPCKVGKCRFSIFDK
jgi:hypothetical protein